MRITDILRHKGNFVATIPPDLPVSELVARLAEHRVGALVVSSDGQAIDGIVSERDVVRRLAVQGQNVLTETVSTIMTITVTTCKPDDSVDDLMRVMTDQRVRHLPVLDDGRLVGLVSIGDVVKRRIDELTAERDQLVGYINQ
ncbi:MAG: CBS domain-containing protein [Angustibacter sp.]